MSATTRASAKGPRPSPPGSARTRPSVPSLMAPICSGKAKTARTSAARAAAVNIGQRPPVEPVRSPTNTGRPSRMASQQGPSPMVNWISPRRAVAASLATTEPSSSRPVSNEIAAPSTGRTETAPAHSRFTAEPSAEPSADPPATRACRVLRTRSGSPTRSAAAAVGTPRTRTDFPVRDQVFFQSQLPMPGVLTAAGRRRDVLPTSGIRGTFPAAPGCTISVHGHPSQPIYLSARRNPEQAYGPDQDENTATLMCRNHVTPLAATGRRRPPPAG